jgi:hypothetical protein
MVWDAYLQKWQRIDKVSKLARNCLDGIYLKNHNARLMSDVRIFVFRQMT